MASIIVPSRRIWTWQPQQPTRPNTSSELSDGLRFLVNVGEGHLRDSISGKFFEHTSAATTPAFVIAPYGKIASFDGASDSSDWSAFAVSNEFSFLYYGVIPSSGESGTYRSLATHGVFGVAGDWTLYQSSDNKLYVDIPWVIGNVVSTTSTVNTTDPSVVVLTRTGTTGAWTYNIYINGSIAGTNSTASNFASTAHKFSFASLGGTNNRSAAKIALSAYYGRALAAQEVAALSRNPWQLFQPANSPIFYSLPAATGGTTLSGTITESEVDTASGAVSFKHYISGTVTESEQDIAAGTVSFKHYLSGTVVEDGADTAAGAISLKHYLSGTVVESPTDTASGTITVTTEGHFLSGAVVEDGTDTASGAITFKHYLSGTVAEDGTDTASGQITLTEPTSLAGTVTESEQDTASGAVSFKHYLSGTVTESSPDSASGTLDNPEAEVPVTQQPAGGRPSRKRRKYQVEIDGQAFSVDSPAEAQQLLEQAEEIARAQAEQAAERAANAPKRAKRKLLADARKTLKTPDVRMIADDEEDAELLEAAAQEFIARINELYADTMRAIEIGALLRVRIDNDEDDAIVALLMAA